MWFKNLLTCGISLQRNPAPVKLIGQNNFGRGDANWRLRCSTSRMRNMEANT